MSADTPTKVKAVPPKKGTAHLVPAPKPRPPVPGPETRGKPMPDISRKDLSQVQRQLTIAANTWHMKDGARADIHRARQEHRAFEGSWPMTLALTRQAFDDLCNDAEAALFLANIRAKSIFVPLDGFTRSQYLAAYLGIDRIEIDEDAPGASLR
jgi:hypothetical protein